MVQFRDASGVTEVEVMAQQRSMAEHTNQVTMASLITLALRFRPYSAPP